MSDGRKYYCYCDSNCKFETMTKEQILAAIAQAVETGKVGDCDTGFITKVKETNGGGHVTLWVGTRAQYNAIAEKAVNCAYIITDDTTGADILKTCERAAETANEALQVASGMQCIDISNKIALSFEVLGTNGANLTTLEIAAQKYIYVPALGVVFYRFVMVYSGAITDDEVIPFVHHGGYAAKDGVVMPVQCSSASFYGTYQDNHFTARPTRDIDLGTSSTWETFSGWYFCDGE